MFYHAASFIRLLVKLQGMSEAKVGDCIGVGVWVLSCLKPTLPALDGEETYRTVLVQMYVVLYPDGSGVYHGGFNRYNPVFDPQNTWLPKPVCSCFALKPLCSLPCSIIHIALARSWVLSHL